MSEQPEAELQKQNRYLSFFNRSNNSALKNSARKMEQWKKGLLQQMFV